MIQDHDIPALCAPPDLLAGAFAGPGRDDLLAALRLCFQGERVFTSELRREIAVRGLDLEALARFDTAGPLPYTAFRVSVGA